MADATEPKLQLELIQQLKIERGHVKGKITKKHRKIKDLMLSRDNVTVVNEQFEIH